VYAIAGIYDPDASRTDLERDLARMRSAIELPTPTHIEVSSGPGAGCVALGQPVAKETSWIACDSRRSLSLLVAGELYAREELRAALGSEADPGDSDARLCLRLYVRDGADFIRRLNGHFNVIIHHETDRRLLIGTDPFGYRPLFLATYGRRVLFASEMKAILAALDSTPAIDGLGLLQLARQGWPLGERTWLEPIQLTASGTWYDITPNGMRRSRYYRLRFERGTAAASLSAYVDGFADNLRRAMRRVRAEPGRLGLALSGGLDSRALLLAADGAADPLLTYTFGHENSRDVRYAAELARIARVTHLRLPYEPGYLGRLLAPIVWRTEGLLPFAEVTFSSIHFHDILKSRVDVLVYGHAGDALTGAHLPESILLWRSRQRLIDRLFRKYERVPETILRRVFRPSFYRRFVPGLYESLRATITDIDQDDLADVLDVWDMENRQRRGTFASPAVDRWRFGVRAPFLDRDLVEHLRQARPIWRVQQIAYKRMIATVFPHAAAVPLAHTGSRIYTHRLADFTALARNYGRRYLPAMGAPGSSSERPAFRDLCADTRGDSLLARTIREFTASASFPDEVFDRQGIEDIVQRHWEGGEDLTHLVSMLATFATAYRLLLWKRPTAIPSEAVPAA